MREKFASLAELRAFLRQCQAERREWVSFQLMGQQTDPQLHQALDQMLPMAQRTSRRIWRDRNGHAVTMTLCYRDGVRLADAWRRKETHCLTEEEKAALDCAWKIVRANPTVEGMAAYLMKHIAYENPKRGSARYSQIVSGITALVEGCANCQGISDAMYLLGTLAGYEMGYQQGWNPRGEHLWNTVRMDVRYYALDVTRAVAQESACVQMMGENACREVGLRWEIWAETAKLTAD